MNFIPIGLLLRRLCKGKQAYAIGEFQSIGHISHMIHPRYRRIFIGFDCLQPGYIHSSNGHKWRLKSVVQAIQKQKTKEYNKGKIRSRRQKNIKNENKRRGKEKEEEIETHLVKATIKMNEKEPPLKMSEKQPPLKMNEAEPPLKMNEEEPPLKMNEEEVMFWSSR